MKPHKYTGMRVQIYKDEGTKVYKDENTKHKDEGKYIQG